VLAGMPADFIQASFDPSGKTAAWGLKGEPGASQRWKSLSDATTQKTNAPAVDASNTIVDAADALFSAGTMATDISSLAEECGWTQATVGLHQASFVIRNLTEGALYLVEVEAAAKFEGPILSAGDSAFAPDDTPEGPRPWRVVSGADLTGSFKDDSGALSVLEESDAQTVFRVFQEEPGAEKRRGAAVSDLDEEEEWERNIERLMPTPDSQVSSGARATETEHEHSQGGGDVGQVSWSDKGWTGEHMQRSLSRYSSVLRDRRKVHVLDIALPNYTSARCVSKQISVVALRRPRPVGRPHVYFSCSCDVQLPTEVEDSMALAPAPGRQRFCSNTMTLWWFRPEEFAPVLITGYTISDNTGRSFWVSRHHAERLAWLLAEQARLPCASSTHIVPLSGVRGSKISTCTGAHVYTLSDGDGVASCDNADTERLCEDGEAQELDHFVPCAFLVPVEANTTYCLNIVATTSHPLVCYAHFPSAQSPMPEDGMLTASSAL
jgi:hypothetical protein